MVVLYHFYSVSCSFLPTIVYFCSYLLTKTLIQMSEFIIHNVLFDVANRMCDFNGDEEKEKPVYEYPNHYLGKVIGEKGKELTLYRKRRDGYEEQVPNYVLRNEGGIALIRIHNKENYTLYDLPENTGPEVSECVGVNHNSYPFAYVVVDCRDNRCQIAIEKTPNWDSKTDSIRNCLQKFFEQKTYDNHKERMDANDRRNADLTVMLLDYTSPLDLPQLPCNQGDDISDGALQEVLAGNLHTTRDLNRQVM